MDSAIQHLNNRGQGLVPERPISANPGLNHSVHLQTCALLRVTLGVIITVSQSKDSIVFCKLELNVIDKKITLKIWFNLGLNSTIFRGTGHRRLSAQLGLVSRVHTKNCNHFSRTFQGPN